MQFWQFTGFMPTEQVLPLAKASEELGFEGLAIPDHLFFPQELHSAYPGTADGSTTWGPEAHWPETWALASAAGAITTTLRFMSAVYIAPARDLFTVAKSVSTAAVLTGGRVVAGFGAGWCREEFEQTGQPYAGRGRRLAEMIEVLPRLWSGEWVEHHGTAYDFPPLSLAPAPGVRIPILLGGRSEAARRRAARIADGWCGGFYHAAEAPDVIAEVLGWVEEAGRDPSQFEVFIALREPPTAEMLGTLGDAGLDGIWHPGWTAAGAESPVEAKIEASARFAEGVMRPLRVTA